MWVKHLGIRWVPGGAEGAVGSSWPSLAARRGSKLTRQEHVEEQGHFVLEDLTGGSGVFYTTYNAAGLQRSTILEARDVEEERVRILSPDSSVEIERDQLQLDGSSIPIESNQSEVSCQFLLPYSRKFSRGANFRNFHRHAGKRENKNCKNFRE